MMRHDGHGRPAQRGIDGGGSGGDALAPVIPLFGSADGVGDPGAAVAAPGEVTTPAAARHAADGHEPASDAAGSAATAETALVRRLRGRSLSVHEARSFLAGRGVDGAEIERIIASMLDYGYLDDVVLAEHLVHIGVDRRSQGRRVIAQTLARRGIAREVADAALDAMPDDDAERALETARAKARSMARLDHDVALRRLVGQLGRRGYGGALALSAARQALDEL